MNTPAPTVLPTLRPAPSDLTSPYAANMLARGHTIATDKGEARPASQRNAYEVTARASRQTFGRPSAHSALSLLATLA